MYKWQYNGVAPFDEIVKWCMEHLYHGGHYEPTWEASVYETIYFYDEKEYAMFLLRWA
jgi:hypothetical protein